MTEFKKASLSDIPMIRKLAHTIWPATYNAILPAGQVNYMLELFYSEDSLKDQAIKKKHQFILSIDKNRVTGFASYSYADKSSKKTYHLHKLYISLNHQQTGIGKQLLNAVIDNIKAAGGVHLELNVNRNNNPAIQFYKKAGFKIIKEEDIDIGNGYFMNDFVMQRAL